MEILDFSLSSLRNEEHHEFQADFFELVNRFASNVIEIQPLFPSYSELFNAESDALNYIRKNDLTDEMMESDFARDTTYRGLFAAVRSACNHFNADKQKAGERIQIVLDGFGNIADKSFEAETTSINNLVSKLTRDYADDIALLGLTEWLDELLSRNAAFVAISNQRYTKESAKTQYRMKEIRLQVDAAYKTIVKKINALVEINGPSAHSDFIKELNLRIEKYTNKKAIRAGLNDKEATPSVVTPS
jgi:hypothetical protein